ncbi:MAG: SDR family NAD(P)-dependent oxidoreductase [Acidobacteria bacterium]|nr:SDR family NAD(P)-dependent oxidoreductase [Acidobacteriota bacterium]
MRKIALITGATSGLGAEFAQQLAQSHHDLVLVARDHERLKAKAVRLRAEFGVVVEVLTADLVTDDGVATVAARLADTTDPVTLLINNAGFGLAKPFEQNQLKDELDHLRILVQTPMELMHAALAPMLERGSGSIINVASVAGFIPRGTYGAAKSWVISFSRWANLQYGPRGVNVTAVCPGFVHTEFHQRMSANTKTITHWMWLDAPQVVSEALADAQSHRAVSIPSRRYKAVIALSKIVPPRLAAAVGRRGR